MLSTRDRQTQGQQEFLKQQLGDCNTWQHQKAGGDIFPLGSALDRALPMEHDPCCHRTWRWICALGWTQSFSSHHPVLRDTGVQPLPAPPPPVNYPNQPRKGFMGHGAISGTQPSRSLSQVWVPN